MTPSMVELAATLAWYGYITSLVYLLTVVTIYIVMLAVAIRENGMRARESRIEDFGTLRSSPFTVPVSVVAPAFNEEICVSGAVRSMLALDYPEYEVIVVNDGSTDGTLARLRADFELEPSGDLFRRMLPSNTVRQIYRSRRYPRLVVVDQPNGGKADALNCGTNLARYRYVCCVDGDTIYAPDALLKGMRLINHDPARVIGVTSLMSLHRHPEQEPIARRNGNHLRVDRHLLTTFQTFDFLRSIVASRLAWSRGNYMLCAPGGFAIWRRDVVIELGGFSKDFTCEDIEFTFRVHEHFRAAGTDYRILSLPDPVCVTEGPDTITALVSQRARWQRVTNETVWHYRRMFLNWKYGAVGMIGMPYYLIAEVLAPIFQTIGLLTVPLGAFGGVLGWGEFWRGLAILAFGGAAFTNMVILVQERNSRRFCARDLPYLILVSPLEMFLYRPIIFWAQFKGMLGYFRGERGWDKFARNRRELVDPEAPEPAL